MEDPKEDPMDALHRPAPLWGLPCFKPAALVGAGLLSTGTLAVGAAYVLLAPMPEHQAPAPVRAWPVPGPSEPAREEKRLPSSEGRADGLALLHAAGADGLRDGLTSFADTDMESTAPGDPSSPQSGAGEEKEAAAPPRLAPRISSQVPRKRAAARPRLAVARGFGSRLAAPTAIRSGLQSLGGAWEAGGRSGEAGRGPGGASRPARRRDHDVAGVAAGSSMLRKLLACKTGSSAADRARNLEEGSRAAEDAFDGREASPEQELPEAPERGKAGDIFPWR